MGCHHTSEAYKNKIIDLSKFTEQQSIYLIENIMVSTELNEKDIYHLMKKFYQLDPNDEGLLSNSQLLEFPQFKYSPFRKHLLRVFKLDTSEEDLVQQVDNPGTNLDKNNNIPEKQKPKNLIFTEEDNQEEEKEDSEFSKIKDARFIDFSNPNKLAMKDENNLNRETRNNFISSLDNSKQRKNSYVNIPITLGKQYINFQKFCEIMKVFHYRCDVEEKIKFYFNLFDADGNGKITKGDLKEFLKTIDTVDQGNNEFTNDKSEEDICIRDHIESMIERIMNEILINSQRKYIDYFDFRNVMLDTNIDRTCVIDFQEDD